MVESKATAAAISIKKTNLPQAICDPGFQKSVHPITTPPLFSTNFSTNHFLKRKNDKNLHIRTKTSIFLLHLCKFFVKIKFVRNK